MLDGPSWSPAPEGYTVGERVALSGMAEVWRATGPGGSPVLLKRPRPDRAGEEVIRRLFEHECYLGRLLTHPHLVRVLATAPADPHGPWMALRPVSGVGLSSVRARARAHGGVDPVAVLRVVGDVLEALEHVHGLRDETDEPLHVVHRDVCPPNVLLNANGEAVLTDLGVASSRRLDLVAPKIGRVRYMAPEQVRGGRIDHRADLYAVGTWAWELLTGRDPWGDAADAWVVAQLEAGVGPRCVAQPGALGQPAAITSLLVRLLAADPSRRPTSAGEAVAELVWAMPELWEWESRARVAALLPAGEGRPTNGGDPPTQVTGIPLPTLIPEGPMSGDQAYDRWLGEFQVTAAWQGSGERGWEAIGPGALDVPRTWADLVRQVVAGSGRVAGGTGGVAQFRERVLLWRTEGGWTLAVLSPRREAARALWPAVLGYLRERRALRVEAAEPSAVSP